MAPSHAGSNLPSKDAGQQEAVASCMDRLKPTFKHFQAKRLAFEIRDVGFTPAGTLDTLQLLVRWIFDRAVSDPQYSSPCAALCFSLTPILPTFKPPGALTAAAKAKRIDFRQTLLNLCQREFESAVTTSFAPQPSGACGDTTWPKASPANLLGSLQFLAHLYLHHLLTDRIMLSCLLMVGSGGQAASGTQTQAGEQQTCGGPDSRAAAADGSAALRVECLVKALLVAGRQLDECLAAQHRPLLDGLYDELRASQSTAGTGYPAALPADLQAQLAQLLELRQANWPGGSSSSQAPAAAPPSSCGAKGLAGAGSGMFGSSLARSALGIPKGADGVVTAAAVRPSKILVSAAGTGAGKAAGPGQTAFAGAAGCVSGSPTGTSKGGPTGSGTTATGPLPFPSPLRRAMGGSSSSIVSRPSSQNLDGLWDLTQDTYSEVRAQLLSQPVVDSPATLEAMADELVESAVAASGGAGSVDEFYLQLGRAGAAESPRAPGEAAMEAAATPERTVSDEDWAAEVQRQWDEQYRACEIYVGLCVDALQHMSAAAGGSGSGSSSGGSVGGLAGVGPGSGRTSNNGAAGTGSGSDSTAVSGPTSASRSPTMAPEGQQVNGAGGGSQAAPAGPGPAVPAAVSDTGRAFRRMLLSAAQSHFERCLTALVPPQPSTPHPQTPDAAPAGPSRAAAAAASTAEDQAAPGSTSAGDGTAGSPSRQQQQRAWADQPDFIPDAASALPRARGMCHLLLGLLRHSVLTPRIVLHCAAALVDGADGGSVPCLECACILLAGAGKQVRGFKVAEAAAFESLVKRVQGMAAEAAETGASAPSTAARAQRRRLVAWLTSSLRVK